MVRNYVLFVALVMLVVARMQQLEESIARYLNDLRPGGSGASFIAGSPRIAS